MKVAVKNCIAFQTTQVGTITKLADWKGICLLIDLVSGKMTTSTTATKVEENASLPAEKFKVPSSFTVK